MNPMKKGLRLAGETPVGDQRVGLKVLALTLGGGVPTRRSPRRQRPTGDASGVSARWYRLKNKGEPANLW